MKAFSLVCFKCRNFRRFQGGCLAFPNGIPDQITSGQNQHSQPLIGQTNSIVFEPIRKGDEDLIDS